MRALCEACPVRQEYLEAALADDSLVGLWGGTTEVETTMIKVLSSSSMERRNSMRRPMWWSVWLRKPAKTSISRA